jgi:16S rRNA (guanine527-N7)-methyltransferase
MAGEAGRTLGEEESSRMAAHYLLLRKWSRRMNLTGLDDEASILRRHFLEPIAAADLVGEEGDLLDLGSGNGFPAVPLAVLHPGVRLTLVEATEKRSAFLWALLRELGLKGARVETRRVCRRADLADLLPVRWLTFRAIRATELLADEGPVLLQPDGKLLAFVSEEDAEKLKGSVGSDLRWAGKRPLPSSPGDVVAIFEPARTAQSAP